MSEIYSKCDVCGDLATGLHYGVMSCNGCKGFFRRTVWQRQRYICRYNEDCVIDKEGRNVCRYCRFQKCLTVGMKRDAIQHERDQIGKKPKRNNASPAVVQKRSKPVDCSPSVEEKTNNGSDYLVKLLEIEAKCISHRESVLKAIAASKDATSASIFTKQNLSEQPVREATLDELQDVWRAALLATIEWSKDLPFFKHLPQIDQVLTQLAQERVTKISGKNLQAKLLRNCLAQYLLFYGIYESVPHSDMIFCVFSNCYIKRDTNLPDINKVTSRTLDELGPPMRQLALHQAEFILLKLIIFLNVDLCNFLPESQSLLISEKEKAIQELFNYENSYLGVNAGLRFGQILLLTPKIYELGQQLIETVRIVNLFKMSEIHDMLKEVWINDDASVTETKI